MLEVFWGCRRETCSCDDERLIVVTKVDDGVRCLELWCCKGGMCMISAYGVRCLELHPG